MSHRCGQQFRAEKKKHSLRLWLGPTLENTCATKAEQDEEGYQGGRTPDDLMRLGGQNVLLNSAKIRGNCFQKDPGSS